MKDIQFVKSAWSVLHNELKARKDVQQTQLAVLEISF